MEDYQYKALELAVKLSGSLDRYLLDCMIDVKQSELDTLHARRRLIKTNFEYLPMDVIWGQKTKSLERLRTCSDLLEMLEPTERVLYVMGAVINEYSDANDFIVSLRGILSKQQRENYEPHQEPVKWWQKIFK